MPDRRPRGSGFAIQLHRAFFERDLRRAGHQRLGYRRQRERPFGVAVAGQYTRWADHCGSRVGTGQSSSASSGGIVQETTDDDAARGAR